MTSLVLQKLWTRDVEEICCCAELTEARVCFVQTAEHMSALFMTVVDWQWQFFSIILYDCYVQYFSRISAENVGSQPNFSRIFLIAMNSSRNFIPAIRNFFKSAWVYVQRFVYITMFMCCLVLSVYGLSVKTSLKRPVLGEALNSTQYTLAHASTVQREWSTRRN